MNGEDDLIAWLCRQQDGAGLSRPGDDAAVLGRGAAARALTVDQQIAGVHVPADLDPAVWARRLLAVNLSDLAAMGALPVAALLTLAVPSDFAVRPFLRAMVQACSRAGMHLAGGDVATAPLAVTSLTVVGRRPPGSRWVERSAARPGDRLWLGGPVGISSLGLALVQRGARLAGGRVTLPYPPSGSLTKTRAARLAVRRHLAPEPQLALGRWLGRRRRAAAIDVSDGLARDLHRLCRASGVGAEVDIDSLPVAAHLSTLAAEEGLDLTSQALGGGEDYVLLFALGPRTTPPASWGAVEIGRITKGSKIRARQDGGWRDLPPTGWDHLA